MEKGNAEQGPYNLYQRNAIAESSQLRKHWGKADAASEPKVSHIGYVDVTSGTLG